MKFLSVVVFTVALFTTSYSMERPFVAAPLRGSNLASGLIGSIAAILIREPRLSSEASQEMLRATSIKEEELKPKRRAKQC
jgi:hypothetical protein